MSNVSTCEVLTGVCPMCGYRGFLEVPEDGYHQWVSGGKSIQDALPSLSVALREQLITGYHPECWDDLFGDLDDL